ncbi:MAG TPA: extracellular solute-binding protein [Hyphomicrobiales bacterium]|nr:extracellular solute-binding protein [Hyphomicrobiales bacterium]
MRNAHLSPLIVFLAVLAVALPFASPLFAQSPVNGIAMHGKVKYPPDFTHFSYVNPDAPKGGRLTIAELGTFDSLNPLVINGNAVWPVRSYIYESLLTRSYDEPFSLYGLLAESVEMPEDRSWVLFTLRPEARFSDGTPVTADDVIFSLELLRDHGWPQHRSHYSKVKKTERIGERGVKFIFADGADRELPLILGLLAILPKHLIDPDTFERTTLAPPVGSGPYTISEVEAGVRVIFKRNPDYWGRNLAVNRGRFNFDEIAYEYYRDENSRFEAFKKGLYDIRAEADPGRWARDYNFPAVQDGRVLKERFQTGLPSGMTGLVFNTRKDIFADRKVREALILMLDFEWINQNLYHGLYERTQSYFHGSELSAYGRPASDREKALLAPFSDAVREDVMAGTYKLPKTDGSGRDRQNRRKALQLLKKAGYEPQGGVLVNKASGEALTFEMLAITRDQERLFINYQRSLERLGVKVSIRQVDAAQYQARVNGYDYDMIQTSWPVSLSPGNEQIIRWSAKVADQEGSLNYAGVKNPAADAMISAMLEAKEREDFVAAVRALDRVLISGAYVVPLFHLPEQWVAYWRRLEHPEKTSLNGYLIDTWWVTPGERKQTGAN